MGQDLKLQYSTHKAPALQFKRVTNLTSEFMADLLQYLRNN